MRMLNRVGMPKCVGIHWDDLGEAPLLQEIFNSSSRTHLNILFRSEVLMGMTFASSGMMLYQSMVVKLAEGREAVYLVGQSMSPCSLMVNDFG